MKFNTILFGMYCFLAPVAIGCSRSHQAVNEEGINDPIHTFFKGEVRPSSYSPCANGAYYRKMVSSSDNWLGIGGKVTLPTITFDPARINPAKPAQYLDNPSVYLGGNMGGQETDIGLTWEVIKDDQGNVTPDRRAFRPFLRRSSISGQSATYENAPATSDYYWYPGEEVSLSIQLVENKKIKFIVAGAGKRFEKDFDAEGYFPGGVGSFKRVNAIDQVGNEGKPVQPTKTKVENAIWSETYLFRADQSQVVKVPMHKGRSTDMRCPSSKKFLITASPEDEQKGAEIININGGGY